MTETLTIIINRAAGSIVTSYLVWGKFGSYPECDGDGTFVGEIDIDADDTSVSYEWDSPNNSTNWRFIAIPKFMEQVGLPGRLEAV